MNIILFSVSGQEAHQDEAGRDPGAERAHHAEPCEHRPRLPLHCLHDLRLPHPRQALLHPRPHERRRPPLPPLPGLHAASRVLQFYTWKCNLENTSCQPPCLRHTYQWPVTVSKYLMYLSITTFMCVIKWSVSFLRAMEKAISIFSPFYLDLSGDFIARIFISIFIAACHHVSGLKLIKTYVKFSHQRLSRHCDPPPHSPTQNIFLSLNIYHTTPTKLYLLYFIISPQWEHILSFQHGVFNENEMKFYAAEVILGLEHMHRRVEGSKHGDKV